MKAAAGCWGEGGGPRRGAGPPNRGSTWAAPGKRTTYSHPGQGLPCTTQVRLSRCGQDIRNSKTLQVILSAAGLGTTGLDNYVEAAGLGERPLQVEAIRESQPRTPGRRLPGGSGRRAEGMGVGGGWSGGGGSESQVQGASPLLSTCCLTLLAPSSCLWVAVLQLLPASLIKADCCSAHLQHS